MSAGQAFVGRLSVVLPLYRTRAAVPELFERLVASLVPAVEELELVFVDDGCPDRSYEAVPTAAIDGVSVVIRRHEVRRGQHAAVMTGLAFAEGDLAAVMDADLQDAPEDVIRLVRRLQTSSPPCDAVCAGRRGRYETWSALLTGRLYRWTVHRLTHGRIPADAGLFLVLSRDAADRVLGLGDPGIHLVLGLAEIGATVETMAVLRHPRPHGSSSYDSWARVRAAARAVATLTPLRPVLRLRLRRQW